MKVFVPFSYSKVTEETSGNDLKWDAAARIFKNQTKNKIHDRIDYLEYMLNDIINQNQALQTQALCLLEQLSLEKDNLQANLEEVESKYNNVKKDYESKIIAEHQLSEKYEELLL